MAGNAVLLQMALHTVPNEVIKSHSTKKASKSFGAKIKELMRVR